jgi:hypothetical protein
LGYPNMVLRSSELFGKLLRQRVGGRVCYLVNMALHVVPSFQALSARGEFSAEDKKRLNRIASLFGIDSGPDTHLTVVTPVQSRAKAS